MSAIVYLAFFFASGFGTREVRAYLLAGGGKETGATKKWRSGNTFRGVRKDKEPASLG